MDIFIWKKGILISPINYTKYTLGYKVFLSEYIALLINIFDKIESLVPTSWAQCLCVAKGNRHAPSPSAVKDIKG